MSGLSPQQEAIAVSPLGPLCVCACAGSGKTRTAVHRLHKMCQLLDDKHGRVALLSFSNVAVNTFKRDYYALIRSEVSSSKRGPEHQALLEMLIANGAEVSLIGDPHQGIYEFSGANGNFLQTYGAREGVTPHDLTVNYRSVPRILEVANKLSRRSDTADRVTPSTMNVLTMFCIRKPSELTFSLHMKACSRRLASPRAKLQ